MKINLKKYIGIFVSCSQFMQMAMPLKVYSKTVKIAEEEQHNKQKINSKIDSLNRESKIQNEEQKHVEKQISDDKILLTCNLDNCLKYQHNLNSPTSMPTDYEDFNNYLKSSDNFGDVLKKFGNYNIKGLMIYLLKKIYWFFK